MQTTPVNALNFSTDQPVQLDALIIGAGFSGMYQLLQLRDALAKHFAAVAFFEEYAGCGY